MIQQEPALENKASLPSVKLLLKLLENPASAPLFVFIGLFAEHSKGWTFAAVLVRTRRSFSLQNIFPNV